MNFITLYFLKNSNENWSKLSTDPWFDPNHTSSIVLYNWLHVITCKDSLDAVLSGNSSKN